MRILYLIPSMQKNGIETSIINLTRALLAMNIQVDFLIYNENRVGYYQEMIEAGTNIYHIPPRKNNPFVFYRNLKKFFAKHAKEYDVFHANSMSLASIEPLIFSRLYKIPKRIMHIHGTNNDVLYAKIFHKFHKHLLSLFASDYIACSKKAVDWGFGHTHIYNKAKLIYNGIDLNRFNFQEEIRISKRNELKLKEKDDVVIHIGSFLKVKNHKFLLEIFKKFQNNKSGAKLLLVGEGPLEVEIRQYAKELEIADKVIFLGKRNDIAELLCASDCLLFPSFHEGLPMVTLEAQATGLPVLASLGVPSDAKASELFIRLSLENDIEIWVENLNKLMNFKTQIRKPPSSIQKFSIEKMANQMLNVYTS
ncbi:MAG: glycosyltransferase [Muribaculaceae bacterium]|nr:glycosyltransferase [Muribaculaceae bacterium]